MADDDRGLEDTVEMPAITDDDEDLMTRRQVARIFRVTSSTVATWARRGRLPEVRNADDRPRYRRAAVDELYASGYGQGGRHRHG